jgi:hypothetical protein
MMMQCCILNGGIFWVGVSILYFLFTWMLVSLKKKIFFAMQHWFGERGLTSWKLIEFALSHFRSAKNNGTIMKKPDKRLFNFLKNWIREPDQCCKDAIFPKNILFLSVFSAKTKSVDLQFKLRFQISSARPNWNLPCARPRVCHLQ